MSMKPLLAKRNGKWWVVFWFDVCPTPFDTLPDAFNQALRYA